MRLRKEQPDPQKINDLAVIAKKLTAPSLAILELAGRAPNVEQLTRLAYERFHTTQVMRDILKELNPEVMKPVPQYAGQPKTESQIQMEAMQGAILAANNRVLANYSPSRYEKLILKHLKVDKAGNVTLK